MAPKFIRKQAREYMRTHGVRYQQALEAVLAGLGRGNVTAESLLRITIGTDDAGQPVILDLNPMTRGGTGPHGLVVGTTGSGKSEFLRTLVINGMASQNPDEVVWILGSFKGEISGATFSGFDQMPHVAEVLSGDLRDRADQLKTLITEEIDRRHALMSDAAQTHGHDVRDVWDYRALRAHVAELEPMPTCMLVVDDYDGLVAENPELAELVMTISRIGRSLGIQYVLAVQAVPWQLEAFANYRIALRARTPADSRAALNGSVAAFELLPLGEAILQTCRDDSMTHFRVAYSGPAGIVSYTGPSGIEATSIELPNGSVVTAASAEIAAAMLAFLRGEKGDDAVKNAYAIEGLTIPTDAALPHAVDLSDMQVGDIIRIGGHEMIAAGSGLVIDGDGSVKPFASVLEGAAGPSGIFRPFVQDNNEAVDLPEGYDAQERPPAAADEGEDGAGPPA